MKRILPASFYNLLIARPIHCLFNLGLIVFLLIVDLSQRPVYST
jgi:hypothetical protein